jgi:large subunit ribosomal protein L5
MKTIKIEKVTLNVGAGKDQNKLDKAILLLKMITGIEPVKTVTKKRIPSWGLRPGLPIGCKITLRKTQAAELLKKLLEAKDNQLEESQFDEAGNISFGVHEYIDVPGAKYDPKIGIMGFQVCVTLERPGFRVKRRVLKRAALSKAHNITKQEAMEFMKNEFKINIGE